jgi:hypothetical protein
MDNCLFFAIRKWRKHGGYLIIRKSHFGWWPHFLWAKHLRNAEIEHYVPASGKAKPFPPPVFIGKVKTEDAPKNK